MNIIDRIRRRERYLVSTNTVEPRFAIGAVYEKDGVVYRVTRHKLYPTVPWSTIDVFGVCVAGQEKP